MLFIRCISGIIKGITSYSWHRFLTNHFVQVPSVLRHGVLYHVHFAPFFAPYGISHTTFLCVWFLQNRSSVSSFYLRWNTNILQVLGGSLLFPSISYSLEGVGVLCYFKMPNTWLVLAQMEFSAFPFVLKHDWHAGLQYINMSYDMTPPSTRGKFDTWYLCRYGFPHRRLRSYRVNALVHTTNITILMQSLFCLMTHCCSPT